MISRRTWQDLEFKDPLRIENNVLKRLENSRYILFFFHSSSRFLRFPETSVFRGTPFCILETDANQKGFSWMREDLRSSAYTLSRIPFILRISYIWCICLTHNVSYNFAFIFSRKFDIRSLCFCIWRKRSLWNRATFARATKRTSHTVKSKYLHKAHRVT